MNYYNEHDPKAAAWLRELIRRELIPNGIVDERSITEVTSRDLRGYTQCHFFAGIGGWSLALRLAGWLASRPVGTGSCPCQPFSTAGKGLAQEDERHLWPVFFALICACRDDGQPWANTVFGEQVASAIGHGWLDGISADLEAEGYACGATVLGAHSVSAPHQRQRLYWVAHTELQHERPTRPHEAGLGYTAGSSEADGLADAGHLRWGNGAIAEGSPCDAATRRSDRVDDAECEGLQRLSFAGSTDASDGFGERVRQSAEASSDDHRLVLSDGDGCGQGSSPATPTGHGHSALAAGGGTNGVGDPDGSDQQPASTRIIEHGLPAGSGDGVWTPRVEELAQGFWSEFTLAHCRDGKARRIPTEPLLQRVANGIPLAVGHLRATVRELETQIARHAEKTNRTTLEAVREMQHAFWSEAIQWDARGRIGILSPEILLAALCQLEGELGGVKLCSSQSIIKAQGAIMLRVQEYAAKEAVARPPPGREHAQQLARELADSLHELSYESALEGAQSIFDRALGFPLTSGCPARTVLLRGYGNAVVPQCAQAFIEAFLDTQK